MSRFHSHINTAEKIISNYDGGSPFHLFLKQFFSADRKYGSRDRKAIADYCYSFYRVARAFRHEAVAEIIKKGLFLTRQTPVDALDADLNSRIGLSDEDKLSFLGIQPADIFPFHDSLSSQIDQKSFCLSHLRQPDLFLRIRPGRREQVLQKLGDASLSFQMKGEDCISLPPNTPIHDVLDMDAEVVVQDMNSQRVMAPFLNMFPKPASGILSVWDCCAGSGGKSILLHDSRRGGMDITATDIRKNILFNLEKRCQRAGVSLKSAYVYDAAAVKPPAGAFDVIICDVPCSGSGTWSRTPEQLHFFKESMIVEFAFRQEQILDHVLHALAPGGVILYITCSVFAEENEKLVAATAEKKSLRILHEEYFRGYDQRADTLYAAALQRQVRV